MSKKVVIGRRPAAPGPKTADAWIANRKATGEQVKKLTVDVPFSLHARMKSECVLRGRSLTEVLNELFEREFPAKR